MNRFLTNWLSRLQPRSKFHRRRSYYRQHVEVLEERRMLDVTFNQLAGEMFQLTNEKDLFIPLTATDDGGNPISFSVTNSSGLNATIIQGGTNLRMQVSGVDGNGDPFTGVLTFRLLDNLAPRTVDRIVELVEANFYNGLTFHRILDNFVAQGGDPNGDGSGGSPLGTFADEFNSILTFISRGLLAMANSGDDTNNSQFFIVDTDLNLSQFPQHLNFNHSIFGILTSGFETFEKLMSTPVNGIGTPFTNVVIDSVEVFNDNQNGLLRVSAPTGSGSGGTIMVTADSGVGDPVTQAFTVEVVPEAINDRPYLSPQFVGNATAFTTGDDSPLTFTVPLIDLESDNLTVEVRDAAFAGAPANVGVDINVTPASNGTPAMANITLTPLNGFTGLIPMTLGVRDDNAHFPDAVGSAGSFDTQAFTLEIMRVNDPPTGSDQNVSTEIDTALPIQLAGDDGDASEVQQIEFQIVSAPQNGIFTSIDPTTGMVDYLPNTAFQGTDSFTYQVREIDTNEMLVSPTFTVTIEVRNPALSVPVSLDLTDASDDGVSNTDNVTSVATPEITAMAEPGSTLNFLVNGTTTVAATETSSGTYSATLSREMLQVGENTVTATTTENGETSDPSDPLVFQYAPSYEQIYTVPGAFGSDQVLKFDWISKDTALKSELGLFKVDDLQGRVNGLLPGDAGYWEAALNDPSRQVVFARGTGEGASNMVMAQGGDLLAYYLIDASTTERFLNSQSGHHPWSWHNVINVWHDLKWSWHDLYQQWHSFTWNRDSFHSNVRQIFVGLQELFVGARSLFHGPNAFSSIDDANADGEDHVKVVADSLTGRVQMRWEDQYGGGDRDFNDAVFSITPIANDPAAVAEALRIPGGEDVAVSTNVTLEEPRVKYGPIAPPTPTMAEGEFGVFVVEDAEGTVNGIAPGEAGYAAAVLGTTASTTTRQVLFSNGDPVGTSDSFDLPGGRLVGFYYIPGGTAEDVVNNNPNNDPSIGPVAFFSFDAGNPDALEHFRWYGADGTHFQFPPADNGALQLFILDELFEDKSIFDDFLISVDLGT